MPEGIKDKFIQSEIELIIKAKRAVSHRNQFERKSAFTVREAFGRLQRFLSKKKELLPQNKGRIDAKSQ